MPGPGGAPYVTASQLAQYAPAATISLATGAQQDQACIDATETADSYMRGRYTLPMLTWGSDITRYTAYIAIYLLMSGAIGFAPQSGSDANIQRNYYEAVGYPDRPGSGYFPGVQRQAIHPDVTPSIAIGQDPSHDLPQVSSLPMRGWQRGNRIGGF